MPTARQKRQLLVLCNTRGALGSPGSQNKEALAVPFTMIDNS